MDSVLMRKGGLMVEIDEKECTGCGFCCEECSAGIFSLSQDVRGGRTVQLGHLDHCTFCGHCIAVCPEGALLHRGLPMDEFKDVPDTAVAPDVMRVFLLSRRSVKAFKEKPVPREAIEQLIEAGTHAGTASNAQTEGFVVIQDRKLLSELEGMVLGILWDRMKPLGSAIGRRLAGIKYGKETITESIKYYERFKAKREGGDTDGLIFHRAPALIVVHGRRTNFYAHENCAIAARNMEILAASLGLGTCWAGFLLRAAGLTEKIGRRLGIPDDRNIYSAIMLGYPRHRYRKTIPRKAREVRWL